MGTGKLQTFSSKLREAEKLALLHVQTTMHKVRVASEASLSHRSGRSFQDLARESEKTECNLQ